MANDIPSPRVDMDAQLEAEIAAALGDMSVEDMLDYPDQPRKGRASDRELRQGTVAGVSGDDVFVEFGPKTQGVCPLTQFDEKPAVGAKLEFFVERFDRHEGLLILSREGAIQKAAIDALEVGQVIEARCTGTNKGGLELDVAGQQAFMPAGQVDRRHVEDLSVFVGEKMPCEVIEFDPARRRIILSRRNFIEAERTRLRGKILEELEVGQTHEAVISSVRDFGAFADLGGVDGLIHVSDLSWERVGHPSEVVKEGQAVHVRVLKIEERGGETRIGLGLKQTTEDPFTEKSGQIEPGATVSGRVTRLAEFGAFVEIAPGVEGLIHISELSPERVHKVSSVVQENQVVSVKVLSVDLAQRRIGLSLKALRAEQERETFDRGEDPEVRRLKAKLSDKFGGGLKGGLG